MLQQKVYSRNEIVNANDYRKHVINVDSTFRKTYLEPSTDFQYTLGHTYKNVIKIRVASAEIPLGFYSFSKAKKNVMFRLEVLDYVGTEQFLTVEIPEGDYTPQYLVDTIQNQFKALKDMYGVFFRITYDVIQRRVTIHHDGTGPPPCPPGPTHQAVPFGITWLMVGCEERRSDFGLGYQLGFMKTFYDVDGCVVGESVVNTTGDQYFLLGVDDFYTVEHKMDDSYIQCLAKIIVKRDVNGVLFDDGYTVLSNEMVFTRPMDLKQLRIRLLDKYGVPVDLHQQNFSVSLELTEVMNVQLYDDYRNHVWTEAEPRAIRQTTGSSAGIAPPARNFS